MDTIERNRRAKISAAKITHGHSLGKQTRTYRIWAAMKQRCTNKNNKDYKDYGARGISFSPEWADFSSFLADMGECPAENSIERIDVNQGYSKHNCKWVPIAEQARNKTTSLLVTIEGVTKCFTEWCRHYGISQSTASDRVNRQGWEPKKALTTPAIPPTSGRRFTTINGETRSLKDWCNHFGIRSTVVASRLNKGWSEKSALTTPVKPRHTLVQAQN